MKTLFKSETAHDLLALLLSDNTRKYYLSELAKMLKKDPANITREIEKLRKEGIVVAHTEHGKKYYSINREYPAFRELTNLFAKVRSTGHDPRFATTWLLGEDIPNCCPFFSQIWLNSFVDEFVQPSGRAYKKIACVHQEYHLWFYFDERDAFEVGEYIVDRFERDPAFMQKVNAQIERHSDILRAYCEKLPETRLDRFSNDALWDMFRKHEDIHTAYYQWGWIPVAADMFGNNLNERGKKMLLARGVSESGVNAVLTPLTTPTRASLIKMEQESLRRIGMSVQKNAAQRKLFQELMKKFKEEDVKLFGFAVHGEAYEKKFQERVRDLIGHITPAIAKALEKHYATYFYTKFLFTEEQGVYAYDHYLKELVRLVCNDPDLEKTAREEARVLARLKREQQGLMERWKLTSGERQFFAEWGEFMVTKIYRRFAQIFALYRMTPIVEEIGKRLGLTLKQTRFMMSEEVDAALHGKDIDLEAIKQRVQHSVYYASKDEHLFLTGADAKRAAMRIQKEDIQDVAELKGQCGCQGVAQGTVRIVNVIADMQKMREGDILVSIATQPDLLPAMKKAAAFVTDQGGVTSHAAIVAREMNTPCVIGTKIGTKVLKDGDRVEVDATKGVVRKI